MSSQSDEPQLTASFSTYSWEKNVMSLFSSTAFKIFSKTETSHGILSTPSCWKPNSSSASCRSNPNAGCLKCSVGITNLFSSFPTETAKKPLGTTSLDDAKTSEKERVLFRNLMLLLLLPMEVVVELELLVLLLPLLLVFLGAFASFFHFLRIC